MSQSSLMVIGEGGIYLVGVDVIPALTGAGLQLHDDDGNVGLSMADGAAWPTGPIIRINTVGHVGIGMGGLDPKSELQLHNQASASSLVITNSSTGSAVGNGSEIEVDGSGNLNIIQWENLPLAFRTNAIERVRILETGVTLFRFDASLFGDNVNLLFGAGNDVGIHYNGTNLVIDASLIAPSDILVDCGADKTIELQETVWDDMLVPAQSTKLNPLNSEPAFTSWKNGLFLPRFLPTNDSDYSLHFVMQMSHRYKEGTNLLPHVHWTPDSTDTGNVVWALEYTVQDINGTFDSSTVISATVAADGVIDKHQVDSLPTIDGSALQISHVLVGRLTRLGDDGADTFTDNAFFLGIDFHFEVDTMGSRQELTK